MNTAIDDLTTCQEMSVAVFQQNCPQKVVAHEVWPVGHGFLTLALVGHNG